MTKKLKKHSAYRANKYVFTTGGYSATIEILYGAKVCYMYIFKLDASRKPLKKEAASGSIVGSKIEVISNIDVPNYIINSVVNKANSIINS